jgi:hypothetical protein
MSSLSHGENGARAPSEFENFGLIGALDLVGQVRKKRTSMIWVGEWSLVMIRRVWKYQVEDHIITLDIALGFVPNFS